MSVQRFDLIIVGGGMVGLCLACALRESGLRVVVLERGASSLRHSLGRDCRVSAIVRGNQLALQGIGAWPYIEPLAEPILGMQVWDAWHPGGITFDAAEIDAPALGWLVENSVLQDGLRQAMGEMIECWSPARPVALWRQKGLQWLRLEDGRQLAAPLVVGADGARSWVRQQAGIGVWGRDYRQRGIVATIRLRQPHHGMASQRFLPTGPLAVLPMQGRLASIVWSASEALAEELMQMDDEAFRDALYAHFGPVFGEIEEVGQRAAFPLRAQLARHLVRSRLALIGDAAHCIHPLAGLGVNLGLRDAMVLAQEIVDAHRFGEDWGEMQVLAQYPRLRLPDVLATMAAMEGFHRLFTSHFPGLPFLRGVGMRCVGNAGLLKQMLMQQSTGIALPVPTHIRHAG